MGEAEDFFNTMEKYSDKYLKEQVNGMTTVLESIITLLDNYSREIDDKFNFIYQQIESLDNKVNVIKSNCSSLESKIDTYEQQLKYQAKEENLQKPVIPPPPPNAQQNSNGPKVPPPTAPVTQADLRTELYQMAKDVHQPIKKMHSQMDLNSELKERFKLMRGE